MELIKSKINILPKIFIDFHIWPFAASKPFDLEVNYIPLWKAQNSANR